MLSFIVTKVTGNKVQKFNVVGAHQVTEMVLYKIANLIMLRILPLAL
jgi:hypothetical protein